MRLPHCRQPIKIQMNAFVKNIITSLQLILGTAVLAVCYGAIRWRVLTFMYVFNANFIVGAFIICIALVLLIIPALLKPDKLLDHSTYVERISELRRQKREKAYGFILLGIQIIIITGLIQLLLSVVIRG